MQLNSLQFNVAGGHPLVVLHGLFGAHDNWRSHAITWSEERQVIVMDLRNHGMSGHSSVMDYATMAQDVSQTLNQLKLAKVDLLGHSMGGKVAMQLALDYPNQLRSLLIADIAPVVYEPHHQTILAGLNSINLSRLKSRQQALNLLMDFEPDMRVCQFLLKSLYKNDQGRFSFRYNLSAIEANYPAISAAPITSVQALANSPNAAPGSYIGPTLVIKGANSCYILPQHKAAFERLLPNSQLKIMADCGHWLHAEKPELFCRLVSRFLNQID